MSLQLVVASGNRAGQVIPIAGERFVIGRADDCNLKPRSELISRYHCEITQRDGAAFVRDMGSKNGVFLNDEQITDTRELKNGDKLAVGPLEFFIHLPISGKPAQKPAKVKSVSDAVARTVAIQTESSLKNQEESIADWLLAAGESGDDLETKTIDASDLMAHLRAQSEESAIRMKQEAEDSGAHSGGLRQQAPSTSRDAASELLRKFFKGGK